MSTRPCWRGEGAFVAVAILTITVGLVLPGMIAHATTQVADAARRLRKGTLADLTGAMDALGRGDLEQARARPDTQHVAIHSGDEVGMMAGDFNTMQDEVARAAVVRLPEDRWRLHPRTAANPTDHVVVRSLVEIARQLGKQTIDEFVEDEPMMLLLREFGVDYAQGYHVGRPAPLSEVVGTRAITEASGLTRRQASRRPRHSGLRGPQG